MFGHMSYNDLMEFEEDIPELGLCLYKLIAT